MASEELARLLDPDIVQRGAILPFGRTASGETEFAVPEMALELARALMLPGSVMKGEDFSEQDVTDMAMALGGIGSAVGTAPVGSLGIFAGRRAATANKAALRKAEDMVAKGSSRDEIWNETGWFKGADDKWRYEIDDSAMTLTDKSPVDQPGRGVSGPGSAIQHEELAAAYPEMETMEHLLSGKGGGGFFQEGTVGAPSRLVSRAMYPEERRKVALHELQHAAQGREGFASGGSPDEFVGQSAVDSPMESYRRLGGEVEARNVEARSGMTPEERKAVPPWQMPDVTDEEMIMRVLAGSL